MPKPFGGDGHGAQRRHDERAGYLRSAEHKVLHAHGEGDLERLMQRSPIKAQATVRAYQPQLAPDQEPVLPARARHHGGGHRGQRRACHAPEGDEEAVEDDIEDTHRQADGKGRAHIAGHAQHTVRQSRILQGGLRQGPDEEIGGGQRHHLGPSAQPQRQLSVDSHAQERDGHREHAAHDERLPQHKARALHVLGTHGVSHQHGKAAAERHRDAAQEPRRGRHQRYAGRGRGSQLPHHHGVDILHNDAAQLDEHTRHTQIQHKPKLIAPA